MVKLDLNLPENYVPSDGEINNFVYLTCKYTVGWNMRDCDLAVCKMMAGPIQGSLGLSRLLEVTTEYLWDHICGEPSLISPKEFAEYMVPYFQEFYANSSPEQRSNTN